MLEVKLENIYIPAPYSCYYSICLGTFRECSFQDFYAKIEIDPGFRRNFLSVRVNNNDLEHSFKILDVRSNGTYEHELGVVLQPAYYLADWQNLIQFFESWLANGATKYYIYHYSWTKQVDSVVKFYKQKLGNWLEILSWSGVPVREIDKGNFGRDANTRIFNLLSEAAMNNALYRAKGKVKFLAMMDLDEIMYVESGLSLIPFLHHLHRKRPDAAQFSFEWFQASAELSLLDLNKPADIDFDYLRTMKFVTKDALTEEYFNHSKVIHIPDKILDTHNTLKNYPNPNTEKHYVTVKVDGSRAVCIHIRRIFSISNPSLMKKSDHLMSPWYSGYRQILMTLHDCRRVTDSNYKTLDQGGLTQCRSVRGCEQFITGKEEFIFSHNSWANIADRFETLSDIFPF